MLWLHNNIIVTSQKTKNSYFYRSVFSRK